MNAELRARMREDIPAFAEKIRAFEAGEVDKKSYKGFSGGFGSYPQRNGGNMLRLRMTGGRLTKERLAFLARSVDQYHIDRLKITTCQTIQFHNLSAQATVDLMEQAVAVDIITRGGGGDFPRNTMASPLSGVERGEYFDVLPWAEATGSYLLSLVGTLHLPRKLKVAFSNGPANVTHATFRDLGFAARPDGTFDVYCAGGLGPNPKLGVQVAQAIPPEEIPACVDTMIHLFTTYGNYENRAKARTRYLQEVLGVEGLQTQFAAVLAEKRAASPKLSPQLSPVDKAPDGSIVHPRVIPQKQEGLYALWYHPRGGNLPPDKPRQLCQVLEGMDQVEGRLSPDGSIYFINLTAKEAQTLLEVTADGGETPFQRSVSCIGGSICSTGVRDSQALLAAMLAAVEEADLPANALPTVHVSGCPSSCGTQQVGLLGFQGASKLVDGQAQPAFQLLVHGRERQGEENLGQPLGTILQDRIPAFIVELGQTVARSGLDFSTWLEGHGEELERLATRYL